MGAPGQVGNWVQSWDRDPRLECLCSKNRLVSCACSLLGPERGRWKLRPPGWVSASKTQGFVTACSSAVSRQMAGHSLSQKRPRGTPHPAVQAAQGSGQPGTVASASGAFYEHKRGPDMQTPLEEPDTRTELGNLTAWASILAHIVGQGTHCLEFPHLSNGGEETHLAR